MDSSCLVALVLGEPGAAALDRRLAQQAHRIASNLLEAEVRAVLGRERLPLSPDLLEAIQWVLPRRALGPEIARVLAAGYLRGADLWHVACALYACAGRASETTFLTLDARQRAVARKLGFAT